MRKLSILFLALITTLAMACRNGDSDNDTGTTPTDMGTGEGVTKTDGTTPQPDGSTTSYTDATIEQVKKEMVAAGTGVRFADVIVTAVDGYGQYTGDVFVSQTKQAAPYQGIKLFMTSRVDGGEISDLKPGDHVKVEGVVDHWPGPTSSPFKDGKKVIEIKNAQITRLGPGDAPVPAVVAVADATTDPAADSWESSLITVENLQVLTTPDPKYGDFDVTGNLSVDDELFPYTPSVGDCISVTGLSIFFYQYNLSPRAAGDVVAATGCTPVKSYTIKEIQQDTSDAAPPAEDDMVKVKGVITAIDSTASSSGKYYGFFMQDGTGPYSGIYVYYIWTDSDANKPKVGDEVEVTGMYTEYYEASQLEKASFTVLGQKAVPAAEVLAAADIAKGGSKAEEYEGVLVKVENYTVAEVMKDKNGKSVAVKDSNGLYVDYALYDFFAADAPTAGTQYTSITGPLNYTFDEFRIFPGSAADMVK